MADTLITNLANVASPTGAEELPVNVPGSPDTDGKVVLSALAAYVEGTLGNAAGLDVGTTAGTVAAGDDSRFTDARAPTAHAASHTNGSDDIQNATASVKGLATAAQITKLDGIEASADVTDAANVGSSIHGETEKTTPVDADTFALIDSAASNVLKKVTWANIKATLKTYFDTLYQAAGSYLTSGGALGEPSSGTLTNCTGLPVAGLASFVGLPVEVVLPCSDEATALTTGTANLTFRMPHAMTVTAVRASVGTAPTGSTLVVDINEGGTSILSTKLSIDATEKTSTTAATAAVISDSALADDAEITIDIDQIGSTIAGAGLKVTLIGTRA
jgi:hypothetical protein